MPQFFKSLYKQKSKMLLGFLLFILVAGILVPNIKPAKANAYTNFLGNYSPGGIAINSFFGAGTIGDNSGPTCGTTDISCFFRVGIAMLLSIPVIVSGILDIIVSTLLRLVITATISTQITTNLAVQMGWPIVRDFANILILVGLVYIALTMILGFKNENSKGLLAKLIIAALLINFSLVICGIFIDLSNIILKFLFIGNVGNGPGSFLDLRAFNAALTALNKAAESKNTLTNVIVEAVGNIIYNLTSAFTLVLYVFLLLFRIIALIILCILSPLALASYVFPKTKSMIFDKWLSNFTQWCFVGVFGGIFYYIGRNLMNTLNHGAVLVLTSSNVATTLGGTVLATPSETITSALQSFSLLFNLIIPSLFLIIGFLFSLQLSAVGGAAVIGFATGAIAGGWAMAKGAGSRAASGVGKATGATDVINRGRAAAQDFSDRAQVRVGLMDQATLNRRRKERLAKHDAKDMVSHMEDRQKDEVALGKKPAGEQAKNIKVESIRDAFATGRSKNWTQAEREEAMDYGTQHGLLEKDFLKGNADMAEKAVKTQDELIRTRKLKDTTDASGKTVTARQQATAIIRRDARASTSNQNIKDTSQKDRITYLDKENQKVQDAFDQAKNRGLSDEAAQEEADKARTDVGSQFYEDAAEKKYLHKISGVTRADGTKIRNDVVNGKAISYHDEHYGTTILQDAIKSNPLYKTYDKEATDKKEKEIREEIDSGKRAQMLEDQIPAQAKLEVVTQATSNLSADKKAELDPSIFDGSPMAKAMLKGFSKQDMKRIIDRGPQALVDKIKEQVVSQVDELGNLDIDFENLAKLPKNAIEDAVKRVSPEIQQKIKDSFETVSITSATSAGLDKKIAYSEDVERAKTQDIETLRKMKYMMSESDRKEDPFAPTLDDEYRTARAKAETETIMPTLPKIGDTIDRSESEKKEFIAKRQKPEVIKAIARIKELEDPKKPGKAAKKEDQAEYEAIETFLRTAQAL